MTITRMLKTSGQFSQHDLTIIPAWISDYINDKVWGQIINHSQTLTVAPLKFGNWIVVSSYIYWACNYWSMRGLKLIHISKRDPCHTKTMMTSSNENIFRVTGPSCGDSPVTGGFPSQRPVTRSFDVFFDLRRNKMLSKQWWGRCDLRRHFAHDDVTVMTMFHFNIR